MTASKFQLHYFRLHGLCIPIRALLVIGGADWSNKLQDFDTWPEVKSTTPFGTLPVLTETTETGEVIEIPETLAIERYLAKKFGMAGSNDREELQINIVTSLHNSLNAYWQQKVLGSTEDQLPKFLEEFKTSKIPAWLASCEKALAKNGSNGHVAGDKITLADIYTSAVMDYLLAIDGVDAIVTEKAAPNLFKVKRAVDGHPEYAAFRKSDEFAQMSAVMESFIVKKFPYDMKKSHIVA